MRRVGRSWYAFGPDGQIIGVYADTRDMRVDNHPWPNVPGLPGATVYEPLRMGREGYDFHRFDDFEQSTRGRTFTAYIEYARDEDPTAVLMRKVQTLADRGATAGERAAARAALIRLAARK